MTKHTEIGNRLREFGSKNYSTMSDFAKALEMRPQTLNNYLSGSSRPGGILQGRLRALGCDIEWLMTGKVAAENADGPRKVIRYHADGPVTLELQKRAERIVQKFIDHPTADMALIEKIIDDLLDGK